jgi:hypothetical protein
MRATSPESSRKDPSLRIFYPRGNEPRKGKNCGFPLAYFPRTLLKSLKALAKREIACGGQHGIPLEFRDNEVAGPLLTAIGFPHEAHRMQWVAECAPGVGSTGVGVRFLLRHTMPFMHQNAVLQTC